MTVLKSRLVTPDGAPIVGRRVTATLMSRPSWITEPEKGRALGTVTTYTDADGLWRMTLLPYTEFENSEGIPYVWYQVDEGDGAVWAARFDDTEAEVWLKDRLIDPPKPDPSVPAIDKLGSLHDVDAASLAAAPEGAVLVKRGGKWVAEVLNARLAGLDDVDSKSVSTAETGDVLEYLGDDRGWGVNESAPPSPVDLAGSFSDPGVEVSPDGMTVRLTLTQRDPGRNVLVDWGDGGDVTTLTPDQQSADRTFQWADSYEVWAHYDGEASGGISDMIDLPYQRGVS